MKKQQTDQSDKYDLERSNIRERLIHTSMILERRQAQEAVFRLVRDDKELGGSLEVSGVRGVLYCQECPTDSVGS